jgi:hypothetical protein
MAENKHRTGERVQSSGEYQSESGRKMQYKEGDLFEACPASGKNTSWRNCIVQ